MFAYVGPGAGLALAGSFLTLLIALLTALGLLLSWPVRSLLRWKRVRRTRSRAAVRRVVILGLDGLDPQLTETLLAVGLLPNLAKLKANGTYSRLATTWPPLSPVAWSTFSTGVNPGKHAIFDFVRPNRTNYQPEIATVRLQNQSTPNRSWWSFSRLAAGRANLQATRRSQSFWQVLSRQGVYSAVLRVPVSFPPERFYGVQLSASSVPDLRGTNGSYTHLFEARDEGESAEPAKRDHKQGRWVLVHRRGKEIHAQLPGPADPHREDRAEICKPLKLTKDSAGKILLHLDGEKYPLGPGQFSPWIRVTFRSSKGTKISAVCRWMLNRWETPFSLYCTPLQIDPAQAVMPISHPASFSRYLSAKLGTFATLGLAEDTSGLSDGVLTEASFLDQVQSIQQERESMFLDLLRRVKHGMIACVFDGPDRLQHMFWKDAKQSEQAILSNEVLKDHYQQLDELVGRTMEACDEQTALLVMSDHGFQAFHIAVDLNAWLHEQGYLHWKRTPGPADPATIEDIDWSRTRAFACGLSGLYLNRQGREAAGIVPESAATDLIAELCEKLSGLKDSESGEVAILEAVASAAVFTGPYVEQAPDIVLGYNAGYRVHWQTALGGSVGRAFMPNDRPWCGDHCQHPAVVPGVLFSNLPLQVAAAGESVPHGGSPHMTDIAPTVLDLLGVNPPDYMDGKSLR